LERTIEHLLLRIMEYDGLYADLSTRTVVDFGGLTV